MKVLGSLIVSLFFILPAFSYDSPDIVLLTSSEIRTLIGDFPARGSQDESLDDEVLIEWQNKRTKADCDYAASQENVTIRSFFGGPRGPLTEQEISALPLSVSTQTKIEIGTNAQLAKSLFNRPRPYLRNSMIKPCIRLERSTSYPSGHTTFAYAMGRILAARFPAKAEALMKRASEAAMNRVIGGVHHPSDIAAGKKLGEEIARRRLFR